MDLKHIIEALRGGNSPPTAGMVPRHYPDGSMPMVPGYSQATVEQKTKSLRSMLPVGLRKTQLHNQEVDVGTASGDDY